ncbi:MAG: hypothetical protein WAU96_10690 [Anaerolineae bacterium]|nr:hypothetical protein [Thermoflexales bacterium]HQW34666.1 hypothetical protein [Thermoflexales bacterium]
MSQNFNMPGRRAVMAGAALFLSCALIVAGFGQRNLTGLKNLYAANCGLLEAVLTEDFESRTQPVLDPWNDELKRAPNAYRVIADSPPALSGHWFEQISGKFADGALTNADFMLKVNVPLDRETHLTAALRSATNMETGLSAVVRSKTGLLKFFHLAPQTPSAFGLILTANRLWNVQGSEDIYAQAYRWLITTGQPTDGAKLIAVGVSFNRAEFDLNMDDITIWEGKACAPEKAPPIADLCVESYFVSVIQNFDNATEPQLTQENIQNKKVNLTRAIETGPQLFDGNKYESLKFKFEQETKSDRLDMWLLPAPFALSTETRASISYSSTLRPTLIVRVDFGGGKSGEMYSAANGILPLTENEKRKTAEAASQGWVTMVTPDIYAWAQDTAKKQNWRAAEPRLVSIGIDVGGLRTIDLKLDNFILYLKQPAICKQFAK